MLSIVIDNIGLRFSKRGLFNLATQNFFENFAQKNIEKNSCFFVRFHLYFSLVKRGSSK